MAPVHVTSRSFDEFISAAGVSVVDFWAPWCAPCLALKPVMENLNSKLTHKVSIGMVDVEEECALAGRMEIGSIPHINVYKDGEIVDTIVGVLPPDKLAARINKHL